MGVMTGWHGEAGPQRYQKPALSQASCLPMPSLRW
jgi:hypothetical protein